MSDIMLQVQIDGVPSIFGLSEHFNLLHRLFNDVFPEVQFLMDPQRARDISNVDLIYSFMRIVTEDTPSLLIDDTNCVAYLAVYRALKIHMNDYSHQLEQLLKEYFKRRVAVYSYNVNRNINLDLAHPDFKKYAICENTANNMCPIPMFDEVFLVIVADLLHGYELQYTQFALPRFLSRQ